MPVAITLGVLGTVKLVYDQFVDPFRLANNTVLMLLTGLIIGSIALLADLIVRSRAT
jgi:hypothetical protein